MKMALREKRLDNPDVDSGSARNRLVLPKFRQGAVSKKFSLQSGLVRLVSTQEHLFQKRVAPRRTLFFMGSLGLRHPLTDHWCEKGFSHLTRNDGTNSLQSFHQCVHSAL